MKKKLITSAVVLVILAVVTMTILYFVGDRMIDSIFESEIEAQLNEEKPSADESGKNEQNTETAKESDEEDNDTENNGEVPIDGETVNNLGDKKTGTSAVIDNNSSKSVTGTKNADGAEKAENGSKAEKSDKVKPLKAQADEKQAEPQKNEAGDKNEQELVAKTNFTADDLNEVKSKVTAADKISVAAMLLKKLSASDINELKSMLPGGISAAEKQRAKAIVYKRFNEDEIKIIIDIYMKYVYGVNR